MKKRTKKQRVNNLLKSMTNQYTVRMTKRKTKISDDILILPGSEELSINDIRELNKGHSNRQNKERLKKYIESTLDDYGVNDCYD